MSFYPLESLSRLTEGYLKRFRVADRNLLLLHSAGITRLVEDRCPHDGSPLSRGRLHEGCLRCPKHGISFLLESGKPLGGDVVADVGPLVSLALTREGDQVGITIDES